jgi:hypothetical protein
MGNTASSPSAPPPAHHGRLHHPRPPAAPPARPHQHTLGFADLHSYLVARCQHDASLTQLAGELHTTRDVVRRLINQAGIQRSSPRARSAR